MSSFIEALASPAVHPDIPADQRIFEPLIGSWSLVVRWFDKDGNEVRREDGEWHFARVLEGRAVQDVWIVPPRGQRGATSYEYGTSLRFHDAMAGGWRSTWIGPMRRAVVTFVAHKVAERIVLETTPDMAPARRWTFFDIAPASFAWKNEEHDDAGWHLVQTFAARRT